jgi:hypothetical protein
MSGLIYVPKYRDVIVPLQTTAGMRGRYKIEAVQPDGRRRLLADWFPNLITNLGLDQLGNNGAWQTLCAVGSGNTAPAFTDTSLQTLVGTTNNNTVFTQTSSSSSPYFGTTSLTYRFAAGVATGNLSEVGVGVSATQLFSRALILDGVGSPTTITVLAAEALDVTYQVSQYVPLVDVTGTVVIAGVTYNYTLRAANATSTVRWAPRQNDPAGLFSVTVYNGAIGAITSSPSGTSAAGGSVANNAYSTSSYSNSGTVTFGLTGGNVSGGISAVDVLLGNSQASRGEYQVGLSPAIPKDATKVLTLSFSSTWARYP